MTQTTPAVSPTASGSAYPVSVADLLPRAVELADREGQVPSLNRLKSEFRIGTDKARALHTAVHSALAGTTEPSTTPSTPSAASTPGTVGHVNGNRPDLSADLVPAGLVAASVIDTALALGPPVASTVEHTPAEPDPAGTLMTRLAAERAMLDAQRADDVARRASAAQHRLALADLSDRTGHAERARRERARDAAEAERLAALYRRATRSGVRARIRTQIQGSAEMRALRIARVRTVTLAAGAPILAAFAAWSTAGVQTGVARLLGLGHGTTGWWAAWGMEPALMSVVALIIIGRAVLRSAGGNTDRRADAVEWLALGTSVVLNIAGGWNPDLTGWAALGATLAHSVGPLGAAATAFLIGLFDGYVSNARPWDGALTLAEMGLAPTPADRT